MIACPDDRWTKVQPLNASDPKRSKVALREDSLVPLRVDDLHSSGEQHLLRGACFILSRITLGLDSRDQVV
jgi:hypothetical protein